VSTHALVDLSGGRAVLFPSFGWDSSTGQRRLTYRQWVRRRRSHEHYVL